MSKAANKAEREHLTRVATLGCIVCRNLDYGETPAEIHHVTTGKGLALRASHFSTIPLCQYHHRTGGYGVALHAGKRQWERNFGTEMDLLGQVNTELGLMATNGIGETNHA